MSPLIVGSNSEGSEGRSDRLGLPVGTSDPGTAEAGDLYYKTDTNKIRYYDGTQWNDLAAGGGGDGGGDGGGTTAIVNNSLRFDDDASAYLYRTPGSAGNGNNWTYSTWIKLSNLSANNFLFGAGQQSTNDGIYSWFRITDGEFQFRQWVSGTLSYFRSTPTFRDPSAWYHIVMVYDSPNSVANERFRLYVNGKRVEEWDERTNPAQNATSHINSTKRHQIGLPYDGGNDQSSSRFRGLMAETHLVDGLSLGPGYFACGDSTTGVWNPKEFTGTGTTVNDGTDWSSTSTMGSAGNAFDGNLSNGAVFSSSGNTLTTAPITIYDSIEFYHNRPQDVGINVTINGKTYNIPGHGSGNGWNTLRFPEPITTSGAITIADGQASSSSTLYGVRVDGVLMLDTTTQNVSYGTNGFRIDYGKDSYIGYDCSTLNNHYTPYNLFKNSVTATSGSWTVVGDGISQLTAPVNGSQPSNKYYMPGGTNGTLTFSPPIKAQTSIEFYAYTDGNTGATASPDGGTAVNIGGGGANSWNFVYNNLNVTELTELAITGISGGTFQAGGFRVDGVWYPIAHDSAEVDIMTDSPNNGTASTGADPGGSVVGNYAVMNPIDQQFTDNGSFSQGNLKYVQSSTGARACRATMGVSSGKWYWEFEHLGGNASHGIQKASSDLGSFPGGSDADGISWFVGGNIYRDGSTSAYSGTTYAVGDCIGTALDLDTGTLTFYKNGVSQGVAASGLTGEWFPAFGSSNVSVVSLVANFGQTKFKYAAPTNFKSLCSTNLPTPDISKGSSYVDAKPYFGTGVSNSQPLGFTPDLLIIKRRDGGAASGVVLDSIRGATKALETTNLNAEKTNDPAIGSFDAGGTDGFTLTGTYGQTNAAGTKYAAWTWDAGETTNSVSAGGLNSSAYNQAYTWSDSLSSDTAFRSSEPATNAFDGSTSTVASATNDGIITFTSPVAVPPDSTIRVWVNGGNHNCTVNGGATQNIAAGLWVDLEYTNRTNSTFVLTVQRDTTADTGLRAVQIGGRILANTNVTPSTNYPSIATSYRATPSAGCSVVSYSGVDTPSVNTVAHGLDKSPELYMIKNRTSNSANGWIVNTTVFDGSVDWLVLNTNGAKNDQGNPWYTRPTPYYFTLGANDNNTCNNGDDYIAYCFHSVEGFSRIGTFNNNDGEGAFVYCGFKPRIILAKNAIDLGSQTGLGDWMIYDTARNPFNGTGDQNTIALNEPNVEDGFYTATQATIDILSNGFKIRHYGSSPLGDPNRQFWFAAWAENPFALNSRAV